MSEPKEPQQDNVEPVGIATEEGSFICRKCNRNVSPEYADDRCPGDPSGSCRN